MAYRRDAGHCRRQADREFSALRDYPPAARSRKCASLRSAASGKFLSDRDVDELIEGHIFHVGNSASAATVGDGGRNYSFSWLRPSFRALHDRQSSSLSPSTCLNSRKFEVTTVRSWARAVPAIKISYAPIGRPRRFRMARALAVASAAPSS